MWAWRCCRRMSSTTPRETSGALPKWDGIQDADRTSIIKPIMEHFRQVTQAALQEHMNLVTSQYMTGWARASREGGIGAATPMNQPDLSNMSSGDLHLLKAPSIIKHQAMIKGKIKTATSFTCDLRYSRTAVPLQQYCTCTRRPRLTL